MDADQQSADRIQTAQPDEQTLKGEIEVP